MVQKWPLLGGTSFPTSVGIQMDHVATIYHGIMQSAVLHDNELVTVLDLVVEDQCVATQSREGGPRLTH